MGTPGDYQYQGAFPTVSRDQWIKHTIKKLSKGYMLIVSKTRNVANFYKGYGDFETCSYHTAKRLIQEGYLEECGEHMLGTLYQLKAEFKEENPAPRVAKERTAPEKREPLLSKKESYAFDDEVENEALEEEETDTSLEDGFLADLGDDADDSDALLI
jgi:hypothetical protein